MIYVTRPFVPESVEPESNCRRFGSVGQSGAAIKRWLPLIVAEDVLKVDGVRHRFDAFDVDFVQDFDVTQNSGELFAIGGQFVVTERQASQ